MTKIGTTAKVADAITRCHGVFIVDCSWNMRSPSARVLFLTELITIKGHKKSFHVPIKVRMPKVASAGFANGRIIFQ
jgi:hypothetical protein